MKKLSFKNAISFSMLVAFAACGGHEDKSEIKAKKTFCLGTYKSVNGWSISKVGRFSDAEILSIFYRTNTFGCNTACYNDLRVGNDMPSLVSRTVSTEGTVDVDGGEILPGVGAHAGVSDSTTSEAADPAATRNNKFVVSGTCELSQVQEVDSASQQSEATIGPITDDFAAALLAYQTAHCSKARGEWAAYNTAKQAFECVSNIKKANDSTHGRPAAGDGAPPAQPAASCPARGGCPEGQFKQRSGYCATYASYPAYRNCQ